MANQYQLTLPVDVGKVSDGFHTFNELYQHRQILFICLMNARPEISWKSRRHSDGLFKMTVGWFIAGMDLPTGQITYHLKNKYWKLARCREIILAPQWDGHTSEDVVNRLSAWRQD